MKLIEEKNTSVCCDHIGCGYTVEVSHCDMESYVNKPCPSCGSNLLSSDDCESYLKLHKMIDIINGFAGDIKDGQAIGLVARSNTKGGIGLRIKD